MLPLVIGETTNVTAFLCARKLLIKETNQGTLPTKKSSIIQQTGMKITIIHAWAISIVRAVGVTKTVSHPYISNQILSVKAVRQPT